MHSSRGSRVPAWLILPALAFVTGSALGSVGVGAKPLPGARVVFDGTAAMLAEQWQYWEGPRFGAKPPIGWPLLADPIDGGLVLSANDPAVPATVRSKFGIADIVTKEPHGDIRLHVEFLVMTEGGNSGVYLQNRYEIQVLDGDATTHGMGAVINETPSPYFAYQGVGRWNAYDILFRAPRFRDGRMVEKPRVTMYFNGIKVHAYVEINQVWGGAPSGVDGGNDGGRGITETPAGLKLQAEGYDVRYRNIWIKDVVLERPNTNFPRDE